MDVLSDCPLSTILKQIRLVRGVKSWSGFCWYLTMYIWKPKYDYGCTYNIQVKNHAMLPAFLLCLQEQHTCDHVWIRWWLIPCTLTHLEHMTFFSFYICYKCAQGVGVGCSKWSLRTSNSLSDVLIQRLRFSVWKDIDVLTIPTTVFNLT